MSDRPSALPGDTGDRITITSHSMPSPMPDGARTPYLLLICGGELGKRIMLGPEAVVCGRAEDAGISLDDEAVSRHHARFEWVGSTCLLLDLGSTNGTRVNDVAVEERVLRDGDRVQIGRSIFKFIQAGDVELSYHEEIYRLMSYDGLTRIHNQRYFHEALEREIARCRRHERPLSLVLFDIDEFKRVNDERGHLAGDAVLQQLATLVATSSMVRSEDVFARVGGEEFGLLTPEMGRGPARVVAEAIRATVERTRLHFDDEEIRITASFGVAELASDRRETAAQLYAAADERLYAAKDAGRNRVV